MDDSQTHMASLSNLTSMPDGQKIATYTSREQLNAAITRLVESGIPSQSLFIVGNNVRQVEVVAGKITYPKAALSGAISGAAFGVFISVVMALVTNTSIVTNALTAIPLGIAFWMLTGVLSVYRMKNKNAFATRAVMLAETYDLMIIPTYAQQARQVLGVPGFGIQQPAAPYPEAPVPPQQPMPPQQGQRQAPQQPVTPQQPPYPQWQQPVPPAAPQNQPFEPGQYQQQPPAGSQRAEQPQQAAPQQTAPFVPPTATSKESKFGLRITDSAEYEAMVRQAPAVPESNPVVEEIRNEPPVQKYGKRIEDPAEYEATVRKPGEGNE